MLGTNSDGDYIWSGSYNRETKELIATSRYYHDDTDPISGNAVAWKYTGVVKVNHTIHVSGVTSGVHVNGAAVVVPPT